jgi:hypothetical protein
VLRTHESLLQCIVEDINPLLLNTEYYVLGLQGMGSGIKEEAMRDLIKS